MKLKLCFLLVSLFLVNTVRAAPPANVRVAITRVRPIRVDASGHHVSPLDARQGWFVHGVQFVVSAIGLPRGARAVESGLRFKLSSRYRSKAAPWQNDRSTKLNRTSFVTQTIWTGGATYSALRGQFLPYVKVRFADGKKATFWGHPGKGDSENFWVGETTYQHALENLRVVRARSKAIAVPTNSAKVNTDYRDYFNGGRTTVSAEL